MAGLDRGAGEFGPEFQGCSGIQMNDFLADQSHPSRTLLAQIKMQEKSLLMTWLVCGDDLRLMLAFWYRLRRNMGLEKHLG